MSFVEIANLIECSREGAGECRECCLFSGGLKHVGRIAHRYDGGFPVAGADLGAAQSETAEAGRAQHLTQLLELRQLLLDDPTGLVEVARQAEDHRLAACEETLEYRRAHIPAQHLLVVCERL